MPKTASQPRTKEIDFPLPVNGIHLGAPWHEIPKGFSASMKNMMPYDSLGRRRLGTRPGLSKFFPMQFGGGAHICQHLSQVTLSNGTATNDYVLCAFNGTVYLQKPGDVSLTALTGHTFSPTRSRIECCTYQDVIYISDGVAVYKCTDLATLVVWAATGGGGSVFPVAGGEYPRYIITWRGRVMLSHLDKGGSGQIFWTKQGDPTNFDYGAVYDPTIAVASTTNFKAGQMANPITAMIPINEDVVLISTSNTLNKVIGDPEDGGQMNPVSQEVGVLNQDAWCMVGTTLYFIGTGGFYRMVSGGEPELLSGEAYDAAFKNLPQVGVYTEVLNDHKRHGIWITINYNNTSVTGFGTSHVFYSLLTGGFYPLTVPTTTGGDDEASGTTAPKIGPTKGCTFDGTAGTMQAREVLIGCRDGYIRKFDDTALTDDVADIPNQFFYSGLLQPAGATREAMLNGAYLTCGENANFNAQIDLLVGKDPYSASVAAAAKTVTYTSGGRQSPLGWRQAANSFFLKMSNSASGKVFDAERFTAIFGQAGPVR